LPATKNDIIEMKQSLVEDLKKKRMKGNERRDNQQMIDDIKLEDYPLRIPPSVVEKECSVFGHICLVYFVSEPFTETHIIRAYSKVK
jgi:hypothetical protein